MGDRTDHAVILGGGLAGLSAGYVLDRAGLNVTVLEADGAVGGLSKTIVHRGFRFDLGGHRFFTKDEKVFSFVRELMDGELISVSRSSKIFMKNRFFDYPLRPLNAMSGLGISTTIKIMADYGIEKIKQVVRERESISLEDWVVSNFGRKMFDIYFREYSEKVWGIECNCISAEWVAQRIRGLSLATAVKNAVFRFAGRDIPTLADSFFYPRLGIGRIAERLSEEIGKRNGVLTNARVERIDHSGSRVSSVSVNCNGSAIDFSGDEFISSIPLPYLVSMLRPSPPAEILEAAGQLKFRDLIVVAIMVDKERVTDQSWIYIPEQHIPFGRIHEPTNWSDKMAPEGKTVIVMEMFSFRGDALWEKADRSLVDMTVENLEQLGFLTRHDIVDSIVLRIPRAYPLFEVGYLDLCEKLHSYLDRFVNLHIAGRNGMFRYYNMDHAIESGMQTAERISNGSNRPGAGNIDHCIPAGASQCDAH